MVHHLAGDRAVAWSGGSEPGKRYEDWDLEDPAGQDVDAVRPIRNEIEQRIRGLLESLGIPVE